MTRVVTGWRITDGGEAIASKGVVGQGATCDDAAVSIGMRTTTIWSEDWIKQGVIGQTQGEHPLVPGNDRDTDVDDFGKVWVSLVQRTHSTMGSQEVAESFFNPTSEEPDYEEFSHSDLPRETVADYYGVAADEYLVEVDVNVFNNIDTGADVTLLTRHNPSKGDIWTSENGNSIHIYAGTEKIGVGAKNVRADRVDIYAVGNVSPDSVLADCVHVGVEASSTTQSEEAPGWEEDSSVNQAFLDAGCEGNFEHVKQGTQWWVDNVLVKEVSTSIEVEITSHGYEWYTQESGPCQRQTGARMQVSDALLYAEYRVSSVDTDMWTTAWVK